MTAPAVVPGGGRSVVVDDARLLAWRELLATAAVRALRTYQDAWSAGSDEALRAVGGIGALDDAPSGRPAPPTSAAGLRMPLDGPFADLVREGELDLGAEALLAAAWWSSVDPQVAVTLGCLHDDASRRYATAAMVAQVLAPFGIRVPLALGATHPLVELGLVAPATLADSPVVATDVVTLALVGGGRATPAPRPVARRLGTVVLTVTGLLGTGVRVLVRTEADDDGEVLREAVAAQLGIGVALTVRAAASADLLFRLGRELPAVLVGPGDPVPADARLVLGPPESVAPPGWHTIDVAAPAPDAAARQWRKALRAKGILATRLELTVTAGRLPLGECAIDEVVDQAATVAAAGSRPATMAEVGSALRNYPRHDPGGLARRLVATTTLDDLVLPAATRRSLDDVVAHARFSGMAHERLGLAGVRGRAVLALFHGPSGTGKTAAAEALANAVDRELWVVDLAKVVSKWLGETQRNLDAVLAAAARAGVVLLFDEADGLFGKRGEVTDARDRYANLEIDHLLQRVEVHTGVVVLTSNRPAALDEAFARRIRLSVRFDLPDHADREELWRRFLPAEHLANGADTHTVAREALSGAAIRAAAVAATVQSLADATAVTDRHLVDAVGRELEKSRRPPTARRTR